METQPDHKPIFKDNWKMYLEKGYVIFPAIGKGPKVKWADGIIPTPEDYEKWETLSSNDNIWMRLDNLLVLDIDGKEAQDYLEPLLATLPDVPRTITGRGLFHLWFNANPKIPKTVIYRKPEWSEGVHIEFRTGQGHGVVIPPSIHPETHRPYQWAAGHSLFDLPLLDIPEAFYQRILEDLGVPKRKTVTKVAEGGSKFGIGGRHNDALAVALTLVNQGKVSQGEVCVMLAAVVKDVPGKEPVTEKEIQEIVAWAFKLAAERNTGNTMVRDGLTDLGNAERLIGKYGEDLHYCKKWKKWFIWDGVRWAEDEKGEIEQKAKEVIKGMYNVLGGIPDPKIKTALFNHAKRSEMSNRINGMITVTQFEKGLHYSHRKHSGKEIWVKDILSKLIKKAGYEKRFEDLTKQTQSRVSQFLAYYLTSVMRNLLPREKK